MRDPAEKVPFAPGTARNCPLENAGGIRGTFGAGLFFNNTSFHGIQGMTVPGGVA